MGVNLKRFDAPPIERAKYLTFKAPTALRFATVEMEVDRLKLISPDLVDVSTGTSEGADANKSEVPEFPIVTYSTDPEKPQVSSPATITPLSSPPSSLPLADPFEGVMGTNVGTTDELLNVFEEMNVNNRSVRLNAIPFIPPYTVAPDSLKIGTKATYRRVPR